MSHVLSAGPQLVAEGIIGQELFDQYAAEWLRISGAADGAELTASFRAPHGDLRVSAVSFPVKCIAELLSAVGVRTIKARFLMVPDEHKRPHFSVALFATDALDTRLTSYYLAEPFWKPRKDPAQDAPPLRMEIANVLAAHWATQWADVARFPLTAQLFSSHYGPLRGYNFELSDFMKPLLVLDKLGDQRLLLELGLHTHYGPGPSGEVFTATFGLMVRLAGLQAEDGELDPEYDLATPIPPGS
ncbi:hypothetical protein Q3A66_12140 [Hymenobacter sp. BT770]|uniref:hypothetical protein n=1 Tax=Hymenobacter sp. BT770 TaxID=2886942 RepID=UPI001D11301B|nr:hypothetical protein [Hymenobacter sp. BT770]MCC3153582.1 hypothetical protein [Hymenobacter sp. BT770]MDO3415818.1 hypothetical protein [Hymenobacter sp. BT770]